MDTPAGATINFYITISKLVTDFDNILIALYTQTKNRVIYSYVPNSLHKQIQDGETLYKIKVKLLGEDSAKMNGRLFYEIKFIKDNKEVLSEENSPSLPVDTTIVIINNELKNLY